MSPEPSPASSLDLFDMALRATSKRGPHFHPNDACRAINTAEREAAEILHSGKESPLQALVPLELARLAATYVDRSIGGTAQVELNQALARLSRAEARVMRHCARDQALGADSRLNFGSRSNELLIEYLARPSIASTERREVSLDLLDSLLSGAERRRELLHSRSLPKGSDNWLRHFFAARQQILQALDIERNTPELEGRQDERLQQLQKRLRGFEKRALFLAPTLSLFGRELAVRQNVATLWDGMFRNCRALQSAVVRAGDTLGVGNLLAQTYVGYESLLGQVAPLVVSQYLQQVLGDHGRIVAMNIPVATWEGDALPFDIDLVLGISSKKNVLSLPPGMHLVQIKCLAGERKRALGLGQIQMREIHGELKITENTRKTWVECGFPQNSFRLFVALWPDETHIGHRKEMLTPDVPRIDITHPLERGEAVLRPDAAQLHAWANERADFTAMMERIDCP